MTEQEKRIQEQTKDAIEVLGFLKKDFENKAKPRCKFARVRAGLFFGIKALEKQVPTKLVYETRCSDRISGYCKSCGGAVLVIDTWLKRQRGHCCDWCGQRIAINWEQGGDTNDNEHN